MGDIPPKYTNAGDAAYGDQVYVGSDLLESYSASLQYLYDREGDLSTQIMSPMRKRFNPINTVVRMDNSWGTAYNDGQAVFQFSTSTSTIYTENFTNAAAQYIDKIRSNCIIELVDSADGTNGVGMARQHPTLTLTDPAVTSTDMDYEGPWAGGLSSINEWWYVGYDKTKPWSKKLANIADPLSANIPSMARAQVFTATKPVGWTGTIPDTSHGRVYDISLNLSGSTHAEENLYVEIRNVSGSGSSAKPGTTVIAREKIAKNKFSGAGGRIVSVVFSQKPMLTFGSQYAIVVRSPYTSYTQHYGLGGWQAGCFATDKTKIYGGVGSTKGNCWTSYNNCYSAAGWIKHDKTNAGQGLPYHEGKHAPVDFGFRITMNPVTVGYSTSVADWLYLVPVTTNPIQSVVLSTSSNQGTVVYQVSSDHVNWHTVNVGNAWTWNFATGAVGERNSTHLWIRASMVAVSAPTPANILGITATITTAQATDGYIETYFYNPKLSQPQGMTNWGGINAPYHNEPNTTVAVDVIRNMVKAQAFVTDGVATTFTLDDYPAYPLVSATLVKTDGTTVNLYEWDNSSSGDGNPSFHVGSGTVGLYDTKVVTFSAAPAAGTLTLRFYPIWLRGLTRTDFPIRLDYFVETFTGSGTTPLTLKAVATDPLREVMDLGLTDSVNDDVLLVEGKDYTVNYDTGVITPLSSWTGKTVKVSYTPSMPDTGLSLAYRIHRSNTTNQVYIGIDTTVDGNGDLVNPEPTYMEYKV